MLGAWNRAEHYRDLADECRRLAATSFSTQMRNRYWRMAESYGALAVTEGAGHTRLRRLAASMAPNGWRLAGPKAVLQLLPARAWGSRYLNRGTVRGAMAARGSCFERLRSMAVIGTQTTSIVCPPALTLSHLAAAGPAGEEGRGRAVAPGRRQWER